MILLIIPISFALFMLLVILLEGHSFRTRPMARALSKSELRRLYRRHYAKPLPSQVKMKALLAEAKTHYL